MADLAALAAPPARVWDPWADPRRLERWWGPRTWPATFVEHDDGSADHRGSPDATTPTTRTRVEPAQAGGGTRVTVVSRSATAEQVQQLVAMGVVDEVLVGG